MARNGKNPRNNGKKKNNGGSNPRKKTESNLSFSSFHNLKSVDGSSIVNASGEHNTYGPVITGFFGDDVDYLFDIESEFISEITDVIDRFGSIRGYVPNVTAEAVESYIQTSILAYAEFVTIFRQQNSHALTTKEHNLPIGRLLTAYPADDQIGFVDMVKTSMEATYPSTGKITSAEWSRDYLRNLKYLRLSKTMKEFVDLIFANYHVDSRESDVRVLSLFPVTMRENTLSASFASHISELTTMLATYPDIRTILSMLGMTDQDIPMDKWNRVLSQDSNQHLLASPLLAVLEKNITPYVYGDLLDSEFEEYKQFVRVPVPKMNGIFDVERLIDMPVDQVLWGMLGRSNRLTLLTLNFTSLYLADPLMVPITPSMTIVNDDSSIGVDTKLINIHKNAQLTERYLNYLRIYNIKMSVTTWPSVVSIDVIDTVGGIPVETTNDDIDSLGATASSHEYYFASGSPSEQIIDEIFDNPFTYLNLTVYIDGVAYQLVTDGALASGVTQTYSSEFGYRRFELDGENLVQFLDSSAIKTHDTFFGNDFIAEDIYFSVSNGYVPGEIIGTPDLYSFDNIDYIFDVIMSTYVLGMDLNTISQLLRNNVSKNSK